jgi:steroid delta-isomerase-like uncharacterized protein
MVNVRRKTIVYDLNKTKTKNILKGEKQMFKKILIVTSLLLVVGLLIGCSGVKKSDLEAAQAQVTALQSQLNTANTALNAANAAKSQTDANKVIVRSYYDALNRGDFNALDQLFASDYKRYLSATGTPLDASGQKKRLAGILAVFPDMKITVDNLIAEGDYVTACLTARCTQKGTFLGIPPTGKLITVSGFEVIRIANGKMAEHWGGTDTFNMLQQIGAVISPGQ